MDGFTSHRSIPDKAYSRWLGVVLLAAVIATLVVEPAKAQDSSLDLKFANGLFQQRRYDLAADEYRKFLDANPKSTTPEVAGATYAFATCKLFLGQYAEARKAFDDFLALAPDNPNAPSARFRVGETSYLLGDTERAAKELRQYLDTAPADHAQRDSALVYAGDLALRQEKPAEAEAYYSKSLTDFPKGRLLTRAIFGLGRACSLQNRHDDALKQFRRLRQEGGKDWAERAEYQIAIESIASKQVEDAVSSVSELEKMSPGSALAADARYRMVDLLVASDRIPEAMTALEAFVSIDPPTAISIQAVSRLAAIRIEKMDAAGALTILESLLLKIDGQPASAALMHQAAQAMVSLNRKDEARKLYERLASNFPDDSWAEDARLRAAEIAVEAKDFAAARRLIGPMIAPGSKSAVVEDATLLAARVDLAENRTAAAAQTLEKLIESTQRADVKNAATYQLALAYRTLGETEKARTLLGSMTTGNTPSAKSSEPLLLLAQSNFEAGKFAESIESLTRYLNQDSPRLQDHALSWLAISYWETGRPQDAAATLERLRKDYPKSATLVPTLVRLGEAANKAETADQAANWLAQAAELADDKSLKARAFAELGHALSLTGKPEESAAAFARSAEFSGGSTDAARQAIISAARVLSAGGHDEEALKKLDSLIGTDTAAADTTDREARLARARLLVRTGKFDLAAADFERYAGKDFESKSPVDAPPANRPERILADWAYALVDAGKSSEADKVFRRILDQYPKSAVAAEARVNLAESAWAAKRFEEVSALLTDLAGETKPEGLSDSLREASLYRAGRTAVESKNWSEAESFWKRLITEFAQSGLASEASFWLAEIAMRTDRPADAVTILEELFRKPLTGQDRSPAWLTTARSRQLQAMVATKKWDEILALTETLKKDKFGADSPEFVGELAYARGRALQAQARFDEARTSYQEAIQTGGPAELAARAQFMRGETYFHQKNYRESLREFLKVDILHEAPSWQAAALLEAAKVYERLNQQQDAADLYERLVERFPEQAAAGEARARLRVLKPTASRAESPAGK